MNPDESKLMGVSIRAWLVAMLVGTTCGIYVVDALSKCIERYKGNTVDLTINEPLYTLSVMAVSFYLGNKTAKNEKDTKPTGI